MADTTIAASLVLNPEQANQSVKSFKQQLKEAQADVIALTDKFGATSKEAVNAAKKAAELKDQLGDAKNLVDAFNPDKKFSAFAQSVGAVTGGFAALQGVLGLVGVASEDVQRSLLKVQSALAISQGLNQLQDSIQSVKNFGAILVSTLGKSGLIGIAIAGVAALGAGLLGLFKSHKEVSEAQKALTETTKAYTQAAAGAIQKVTEVKTAFQLAKEGVISKKDALKIYNDTLGDSLGRTKDLGVAEKNLTDKAEEYIKITGLKAQANALFAISGQKAAEALVGYQEASKNFKFGSEGTKAVEKALEEKEKLEKAAAEITKLGEELIRKAETIAKASKIDSTPDKPKDPKTDPRIELEKSVLAEIEKLKKENFLQSFKDEGDRQIDKIKQDLISEEDRIRKLKISEELKTKLIRELRIKSANDIYEIDKAIDKAIAVAKITQDLKSEEDRIGKLKISEKLKTNLIKELRIKSASDIDEIDKAIALKKEETEKDALGKLRKAVNENRLAQIKDLQELAKLKIEQDYENSLEEIKLLQSTEETKTNLIIEAQKTRDQRLADLETERREKQSVLRKELDEAEESEIDTRNRKLEEWYEERLAIVRDNEELTTQLQGEYEKRKTAIVDYENKLRLDVIAKGLGVIADLVGKHTVAGKVLGVAEATINTYIAASNVLKNATRNPITGAVPFLAIAQMVTIIAAGLANVRNIVKTPVPGAGQGSGSVPDTATVTPPAPLRPQLQVGTTQLNQSSINSLGSAAQPVRAFVLESDVNSNQERLRRLSRAARLGG